MMKIIVSLLIVSLSSALGQNDSCPPPCPDYYWRDYDGIIPQDALAGAKNGNDTLYVGQAFFKKWDLLPATIHSSTGLATSGAYNHFLTTNQYVKVLASPNNSIFEWLPTTTTDLHYFLNRAVPGGSENNVHIYIGRIKVNNQWLIGKIFTADQTNKGFWHERANQNALNAQQFDLLVYNCNK